MGLCRKCLWRRDSEKGKSCHMGSSGSVAFTKESARIGFLRKHLVPPETKLGQGRGESWIITWWC